MWQNKHFIFSILAVINFIHISKEQDYYSEDEGIEPNLKGVMANGQPILNDDMPEDAILKVPQLIKKYNYPVEVHHVVTDDGYVLEIHRIPHGRADKPGSKPNKRVVFIQHGLLACSSCWILSGTERSLGFILADAGYDVWMGNARGTTYSRQHTSLTTADKEFWDFSWHEIGYYDVPAMIDHTLNVTGQEKLFYIGHSQGGTVFWVMLSTRPEYNDKIRLGMALGPAGYMSHLDSQIMKSISLLVGTGEVLLKLVGEFEFLPNHEIITKFGNLVCGNKFGTQPLCSNAIFLIAGFNEEQLEPDIIPVIMGHIPAGSSTKQFIHYGQEINSARFAQYDYGPTENMQRYNNTMSPSYDITLITAPAAIYYSENDWLVSKTDLVILYEQLVNPAGMILVSDKKFNHMDYLFAKDIVPILYDEMKKLMDKY